MNTVFETFEEAFAGMLQNVMDHGSTVTVRGMETKELMHASFTILHPQYRLNLIRNRNGNPFAQIAETLWMLAGRNDLDWLERYIPQCKKWSDDGMTWRAAYGPRLRRWHQETHTWLDSQNYSHTRVDAGTDQISKVIAKLKADPETRQAVISLWDPANDWIEGSKDYPCNNWLHFMIRDGQLHLNVSVRSNDLIYGFSHVDFYGWSVLQQLIAQFVGVEVGRMTWNASSLHVYATHYDKAHAIIDAASMIPYMTPRARYDVPAFAAYDMQGVDHDLELFFVQENALHDIYSYPPALPAYQDYLHHSAQMVWMYWHFQHNIKNVSDPITRVTSVKHLAQSLSHMPNIDMKWAALEYFHRHIPGFIGVCDLSDDELRWLQQYGITA